MAEYKFFNINPLGNREDDCVCRAISLATMSDYGFINYLLYSNAYECGCDMLTKSCYRQVLEDYFGLEAQQGRGRDVGTIADEYSDKAIILRVKGHLTCCKDAVNYDLWDCRKVEVDEFWLV